MLLTIIVLVTAIDFFHNRAITPAPLKPTRPLRTNENQLLQRAQQGGIIDEPDLQDARTFVRQRYDCSDFRLQALFRILRDYPDRLTPAASAMIKEILLGFRYWMDEPGDDSMCFWSENHQILFSSAEYLAGQLYPHEVFSNSGLTGRQHSDKARKRILTWLRQRWDYGFSEWYSNVYYVEDIAPLCNLIDFADDREIVVKSQIILDLLLYDMASQSFRGTFITTSGRLYERHKKAGFWASTRFIAKAVFGYDTATQEPAGMSGNFLFVKNYKTPDVIKEIGRDTGPVIVKASNGLNIAELAANDLIGGSDEQIMMQWGMEAFTAAPVIANSINYVDENRLWSNYFLHDFSQINFTLLKVAHLLPVLIRWIDPAANGTAIQRANTYTYKTPFYSLYTAQRHQAGQYADQQHIFGVTLSNELSVFHTHPAAGPEAKDATRESPNFWVGHGRFPLSGQDENINLSMYILPDKKGHGEPLLLDYTHLYFPLEKFEQHFLDKNRLLARYGGCFIAFLASSTLERGAENNEVVQKGKDTAWICELSDSTKETFLEFVDRIRSNAFSFDHRVLTYQSRGKSLTLSWPGDFYVNGQPVDTEYPRFASPYITCKRMPAEMTFTYNNRSLYLNFAKMIREERM